LSGVHRENGEVVDDEELGSDEASQGAIENAVELGAVQLAEHARRGDEDDAPGVEAGLVGQGAGEERLACAGRADEERVDALVEEVEIVQRRWRARSFLRAGSKSKLKASTVLISGKRASRSRRSTALLMRLCFSSSQRRWTTSVVDRFSLAARSRIAATTLAMPGSLSQRSFCTSRSRSSLLVLPSLSFFFMTAPRSRAEDARSP
jgi:hypothetical protein